MTGTMGEPTGIDPIKKFFGYGENVQRSRAQVQCKNAPSFSIAAPTYVWPQESSRPDVFSDPWHFRPLSIWIDTLWEIM